VGHGDVTDNRILQRAAVVSVAVEGDAVDRGPSVGNGWCKINRSIWSTPSLRALFLKPCKVLSWP
jgi:hypothetical protein